MFDRALQRGLKVERVEASGDDPVAVANALETSDADIVHLQAFLPEETLAALYARRRRGARE